MISSSKDNGQSLELKRENWLKGSEIGSLLKTISDWPGSAFAGLVLRERILAWILDLQGAAGGLFLFFFFISGAVNLDLNCMLCCGESTILELAGSRQGLRPVPPHFAPSLINLH